MLDTILSALLPMVVTFLLGFIAAWRHDFESKDASTLNRMALVYAVPLALFAGTVTTSPRALNQDTPMVVALCVSIIGLYGMVFFFSLIVLHLFPFASRVPQLTQRCLRVRHAAILPDRNWDIQNGNIRMKHNRPEA